MISKQRLEELIDREYDYLLRQNETDDLKLLMQLSKQVRNLDSNWSCRECDSAYDVILSHRFGYKTVQEWIAAKPDYYASLKAKRLEAEQKKKQDSENE